MMQIDSVHFYVTDAGKTSNWFTRYLGFQLIDSYQDENTYTEVVEHNSICFIISSARSKTSPVADYLDSHPEGIVDVAFRVDNLQSILDRAAQLGIKIIQTLQQEKEIKYARIVGWDDLQHSLIEYSAQNRYYFLPNLRCQSFVLNSTANPRFTNIDHIVLNVAAGELSSAVKYYQNLFDWQIQQTFNIQSKHSGLYSQALVDATGQVQFNINEPSDPHSQIQDFIELNGGAGIQHLALRSNDAGEKTRSNNIIATVAQLRSRGVEFLPIPSAYYNNLRQTVKRGSINISETELQAIEQQGILIDWHRDLSQSLLMQIFTQPILNQPTFFLELIERRQQAQGFGEGNFQALYEAVERGQQKMHLYR
ncbi:4-hydroxyphenylpyruvate dioxygenase [Xenococcus sp. PCC 7305]|uniref:4-hydroxyphenylpyruvate dioxygenase n=1 Tax=Xenococcus sp. PCC 7305 TaxID=102125 RepID=UPI0002AC56DA|nr:4-hydroxyphenylpyruvate dioxygenase [Xenococcus sp. PCC 7305]ELS04618.1 4-hydroxyphenylpyruvate dioxygenase [Xenococcus sp. PCC 7305]